MKHADDDDLRRLAQDPDRLSDAAGGPVPAGDAPILDVELPPCPLCGAKAEALSLGARRELAYRGSHWSPWMVEHDCDCDLQDPDAYALAMQRAHAASRQEARFRQALAHRRRYLDMLDTPLRRHDGNAHALDALDALQPGAFAYLWGPRGTGKTHLALRTAQRLIGERPARFVHVAEWLEQLRQSYAGERPAPRLDHVDVLVLDDLGKEKPSAWVAERVFGLIEFMWSDKRTVIITSQYPPVDSAERLYLHARTGDSDREAAAALMSRLASGQVHLLTGPDTRMEHLQGAP